MRDEHRRYRERWLFASPAATFADVSQRIRDELAGEHATAGPERREQLEALLGELVIDLRSYLPRWRSPEPADGPPLDAEAILAEAERSRDLLRSWGAEVVVEAVDAEVGSIATSNLRRLAELSDRGIVNTRWGNDSASGLSWALRRGAVFVTTNPVMVNAVRKEDPARWDPIRDRLRAEHPEATPEERASLMTVDVVLDGCRELRPIWDASDGRYGYVNLQVDPRMDDGSRMADQAEALYRRLGDELGATPNTRFKIPGTRQGLDAVRRLTAAGLAVTVTVNASVDQQLAFAEVIEQGQAPLSFLVLMMGRLDDPVRDELEAAGVPDAVEISRWASVALLRRAYPLLFEDRGYRRSAIMAASMRGPWSIDGAVVDGPSELFLTIFPDKAREYDAVERPLRPHMAEPLPDGILEQLAGSRTFRQAYEVGALPAEHFGRFVPVVQTLEQFSRNYEEFLEYNR